MIWLFIKFKKMETIQNLTIEQAIEVANEVRKSDPTREKLIKEIGPEMFSTLCRLRMISEGATVDENSRRKPVWKFAERAYYFFGYIINSQPTAVAS